MACECKMLGRFRRIGFLFAVTLCALLSPASSAFGQVDQGSITGIVQDSTGAVVPNAQVTLLNTDQGLTLETRSSKVRLGLASSLIRAWTRSEIMSSRGFSRRSCIFSMR